MRLGGVKNALTSLCGVFVPEQMFRTTARAQFYTKTSPQKTKNLCKMTIYNSFVLWYNYYRKKERKNQNEKLYRKTAY